MQTGNTEAQRHKGTEKGRINRFLIAALLCAFVSLCLCVSTQLSQSLPSLDPNKTWAVVIGVSNYASEDVTPLRFAASDAQAMADFLMSPRGGGLRPEKVTVLLEGEATRTAVTTMLGNLGDKVQEGESVYIFIAGHGAMNPSGRVGYFIPADGTLSGIYSSAVSFGDLKGLVEDNLTQTKARILFTDVCHAGRLEPLQARSAGLEQNRVNTYLSQIAPGAGNFLNLLASQPDEYSYESEALGQGVFTHAVLDALNGRALAGGGAIADSKSVVDYVKAEVPKLTSNQQNPMTNANFDPNLQLAFLDRPGPMRMPPVQTSLLIRNTNRVAFERVEWFDGRLKARGTRRFPKEGDRVLINSLPPGEMELKFSGQQNPERTLRFTLQPGQNDLDIVNANLSEYRFTPAGPVQVAALRSAVPIVPQAVPAAQAVAAAAVESILLLKAPANTSVALDGTPFMTSVAADEYMQLTGLTPGVHTLALLTSAQREYRFRLRLLPGSQTFNMQSGEMIYSPALPQDPASVPLPAGLPANLSNAYRNFILALWDDRLVEPQGNSAWDFFTQMRGGLSVQLRDQITERLIIAMGNRAQQTILRYLRGGDLRWTPEVFEEGATLSDRMQQFFQFRPDIQRDIQSRQSFFTGRALLSRGRYAEAIQQLQRSINLFPEASHAFNAIGLAYWQQGQLDQAIQPLQQAIALSPTWTYPRNILALVFFELRRYAESQQAFQNALLVAPDDSSLNHGIAQVDLQFRRLPDAETRLRRAIEFNPGNAYAYASYGRLERLRGNVTEAERLLRLAIRLEPDEPSFRVSLAEFLGQRGQIPDAQQMFNQLARANPAHSAVVESYSKFLAAQNRLPDARAVFEQAVKVAPKDARIRVLYGEFLRTHQGGKDAEKHYKEALKAAQANVYAHHGLANLYLSQGKLAQAEREVDAATKADPRYPNSMMLLGQIRSAQKRYDESLVAYAKALELAVEPDQQEELKKSIESAKQSAAAAGIKSAQGDIDKNRMKSGWATYAGVLKLAPAEPALIEALLKFEADFPRDADPAILPASPVSATLQTRFWTAQREAETLWRGGKREDGARSFATALDGLSLEDRPKVAGTEFNRGNANYGIHQIVFRWASRAIELRDFALAQRIMDAAMRHKIFDLVPGLSVLTVDSLMIPPNAPVPADFAGFDVARHPDPRAHEVLALIYAGLGNVPRSEAFLPALTSAQQTDIRNKIQLQAR